MLQLDDLHCEPYHPAVDGSVLPVPVRVDRDIGGITVLMLAVSRCTRNRPVVIGRSESRVHVEGKMNVVDRAAMPSRDFRDHQLELVEETRTHSGITRPALLRIMI